MSHTIKRKLNCTNLVLIQQTAEALGAQYLGEKSVELFGSTVQGHAVQLVDWKYPIVIDVEAGEVQFDNYGGSWGDEEKLKDFKQQYTVQQTRAFADEHGYAVTEEKLENGELKLELAVGGGYGI